MSALDSNGFFSLWLKKNLNERWRAQIEDLNLNFERSKFEFF